MIVSLMYIIFLLERNKTDSGYCIEPSMRFGNKYLFEYTVDSFPKDYQKIFIIQKNPEFRNVIYNKYPTSDIVELDKSEGQSGTAYYATRLLDDIDDFMVCSYTNIFDDINFFKTFENIKIEKNIDGYIPYFIYNDKNRTECNFIRMDSNYKVLIVEEKKRISNYGIVELYYFKNRMIYESYFYRTLLKPFKAKPQILMLYHEMIENNLNIYTGKMSKFSYFNVTRNKTITRNTYL